MTGSNRWLQIAGKIARIMPASTRQALYRNPTLANLIRQSLNRAAPDGLAEAKIAAGVGSDLLMELDLKAEKDYWLGTYEPELQDAILDLVTIGDHIYDIGANIGFTTLLFAKQSGPNGHVHSFEPLPANIKRLTRNVMINAFQDRITIVPAAVMDKSGKMDFLVGPSTGTGKVNGSAGRNSLEYAEAIQVESVSIDDFIYELGNPPPSILKLDIEGGEAFAIAGMVKLLKNQRPKMLIELHGIEAAELTWKLLKEQGYTISRMASGYPVVGDFHDLDWKSYIVAIPNG